MTQTLLICGSGDSYYWAIVSGQLEKNIKRFFVILVLLLDFITCVIFRWYDDDDDNNKNSIFLSLFFDPESPPISRLGYFITLDFVCQLYYFYIA